MQTPACANYAEKRALHFEEIKRDVVATLISSTLSEMISQKKNYSQPFCRP